MIVMITIIIIIVIIKIFLEVIGSIIIRLVVILVEKYNRIDKITNVYILQDFYNFA